MKRFVLFISVVALALAVAVLAFTSPSTARAQSGAVDQRTDSGLTSLDEQLRTAIHAHAPREALERIYREDHEQRFGEPFEGTLIINPGYLPSPPELLSTTFTPSGPDAAPISLDPNLPVKPALPPTEESPNPGLTDLDDRLLEAWRAGAPREALEQIYREDYEQRYGKPFEGTLYITLPGYENPEGVIADYFTPADPNEPPYSLDPNLPVPEEVMRRYRAGESIAPDASSITSTKNINQYCSGGAINRWRGGGAHVAQSTLAASGGTYTTNYSCTPSSNCDVVDGQPYALFYVSGTVTLTNNSAGFPFLNEHVAWCNG